MTVLTSMPTNTKPRISIQPCTATRIGPLAVPFFSLSRCSVPCGSCIKVTALPSRGLHGNPYYPRTLRPPVTRVIFVQSVQILIYLP
ncbi:hypothetical protein J1614_007287 [Plenodomus biglobosus]|nr:hypothetical protein J1614_007287 [Plenodomus biglobosus]